MHLVIYTLVVAPALLAAILLSGTFLEAPPPRFLEDPSAMAFLKKKGGQTHLVAERPLERAALQN